MKIIAVNQKLRNFSVLEKMEAGLVLTGLEIKSIRAGRISISESFVRVKADGVYLHNCLISPILGSDEKFDPQRPKKLLLKKAEILSLRQKIAKNLTAVPLRVYIVRNLAKVEIALVRGKKKFEKREEEKQKEVELEIARALKQSV